MRISPQKQTKKKVTLTHPNNTPKQSILQWKTDSFPHQNSLFWCPDDMSSLPNGITPDNTLLPPSACHQIHFYLYPTKRANEKCFITHFFHYYFFIYIFAEDRLRLNKENKFSLYSACAIFAVNVH